VTGIAVLLIGAAIGFGIGRWLKLPAIPILIIVGMILPLLGTLPDTGMLEDTLVLGLTFLVFVAGMDLNPRRVGGQRRAALRVGIAQFTVLGIAGFGLSMLLGFDLTTSLYLALAVTASSTLVVVRLLQSRQQLFEPFGRTVIGVLLLQDLLIILLIPVVTRLPDGAGAVATGVLGAAALTVLAFVCVRWVTPFLVLRLGLEEESLLLTVLAVLFVFVGLSALLGLPIIAGAFLAGVSLSSFPVSGVIRGLLGSVSDFFLAIFFTALGALITIPAGPFLWRALALAALVVILTPPLVTFVGERYGLSTRPAIESGLLLAQTSEFSLIVALQGLVVGHLVPEIFSVVALVTVMTMVLTPFLATDAMTWRLMRLHPVRQRQEPQSTPAGHVLLLGCGDNGMPLLETLLTAGHEVVVVDDDPAVIDRLAEGEVTAIRGDGSDYDVLRRAGAQEARVVISTMRRVRDAEQVVRHLPEVPVLVRVFDDADGRRIEKLGGTAVRYSDAAANDFFRWLEQAEEVGLRHERRLRPR